MSSIDQLKTPAAPKNEREKSIEAMFDRIANRYDLLNTVLSAGQHYRWRRALAKRLPRPAHGEGKLLDVATGTGDVIFACLASRPDYQHFIGVDIAQDMLKLAEAKAQNLTTKPKSLNFQRMSARALDFAPESFDAVSISFGLRNVVDVDQALQEFHRVTKTGGSLFILEFFEPEQTILARGYQSYFKYVLPVIGGLLSDRAAYKYLPASVGQFYRRSALVQLMEKRGWSLVEQKRFIFGSCVLIHAQKTSV